MRVKEQKTFKRYETVDSLIDQLVQTSFYNENGQITKQENYDPNGDLNTILVNSYNQEGAILKTTIQYLMTDSIEERIREYQHGQLKSVTNLLNGELHSKELYQYNAQGTLIEEKELESRGQIFRLKSYDYEKGLITEQIFDMPGVITEFYLNDKGWIVKEVETYTGPTSLENTETYNEHDENGNLTKCTCYEAGKLVLEEYYYFSNNVEIRSIGHDYQLNEKNEITRQYDSENRLIRIDQHIDGVLIYHFTKAYNSYGHLIHHKEIHLDTGEEEVDELIYEIEYYKS